MLSVKKLSQINTDRVQAKAMAGIGVRENGPIVKLLPEHDKGITYGLVIFFGHRHNQFWILFKRNDDLKAMQ